MKSRSEIWLTALEELGNQCSVDTARDAETCVRRAAQEGDSFFKVTLPQFAKDLERSLAAGHIPADNFVGWARRNRDVFVVSDDTFIANDDYADTDGALLNFKVAGGIPRFLGGFMDLVFSDDRVVSKSTWDGALEWILHESTEGDVPNQVKQTVKDLLPPVLYDFVPYSLEGSLDRSDLTPNEQRSVDDAASAIHAVRQLCLMFSKEKELPAQRDIDNEIARFVDIDEELEKVLMQGTDLPGIDPPQHPVQKWAEQGKDAHLVNPMIEKLEAVADGELELELPGPDREDGEYSASQWRRVGEVLHQGEMTSEQYRAWMSLTGHDEW